MRFVRVCDTDRHDAASLPRRLREFLARLRVLFGQGWVFAEPEAGGESTCTTTALQQAMQFGTLVMGSRIVRLWPPGAKDKAARCAFVNLSVIIARAL